ncbi:MAG: hypothetical protein EOL88_06120 [Bacteroidia bacterium]|nr:hypothetical protein [Bacteroidia bacterium]
MTSITINNTTTTLIPSSWDEMTQSQLLAIASMVNTPLPEYEFKIKALLIFTGWKLHSLASLRESGVVLVINKKKYRLLPWQFNEMCRKLDFLFKETETKNGKIIHINSKLTHNLFPYIRCGVWLQRLRPLYGPANRLYNLTFGEYLTSDNFFRRYVATGKNEFLDKLIATLYRHQDSNYDPFSVNYRGDRREPFNEFTVEKRVKYVKKINISTKIAIMLWFNGCIVHLAEMFPLVFGSKGAGKDKFGSLTIIDSLTNGDVTKSKVVREQYLWDVMVHLEQTLKQHNDYKNKMK